MKKLARSRDKFHSISDSTALPPESEDARTFFEWYNTLNSDAFGVSLPIEGAWWECDLWHTYFITHPACAKTLRSEAVNPSSNLTRFENWDPYCCENGNVSRDIFHSIRDSTTTSQIKTCMAFFKWYNTFNSGASFLIEDACTEWGVWHTTYLSSYCHYAWKV